MISSQDILIFRKGVEFGVKRGLEQCAKLPMTISLSEAYKMAGKGSRKKVDRAIENGFLHTTKKGGKTSPITILRSEFELWLILDELYNEPVTKKKL